MIVVIIAGGSGTRLWPLSKPEYPKHLLKINGDSLSLLQHTYERAKQISDKIYVVSEQSHIEHVKEQLGDLPDDAFICESGRRGTANCIVAALEYIGKRHDANEAIASIAADHYIRDTAGFKHSFKVANDTALAEKRIVLVGVEPDYPATGFGYIEKSALLSDQPFVYNVGSFKEKPDFHTAQGYMRSGKYLWNCGYFVATLNTFKKSMEEYAPELHENYQRLVDATPESYAEAYLSFESEAIDYALIEKVPDLLVVPASFDWMDLGSFGDLAKAIGVNQANGNYTYGESIELEDVKNSVVQNFEDRPVVVIGLDNCVVINTPQGLLITRKDLSQKVGDVSKRLNAKAE